MSKEMLTIGFPDPAERARLSPSAIRGFAKMMAIWGVEEQDAVRLLGGIPLATFRELKGNPNHANLEEETMTRISFTRHIQGHQHPSRSGTGRPMDLAS